MDTEGKTDQRLEFVMSAECVLPPAVDTAAALQHLQSAQAAEATGAAARDGAEAAAGAEAAGEGAGWGGAGRGWWKANT